VNEAASAILEAAGEEANVIFGAVIDPEAEGEVTITVIATGFAIHERAERSMLAQPASNRPAPRLVEPAVVEERINLETPAWSRRAVAGFGRPPVPVLNENLDVPTFMRKHAE